MLYENAELMMMIRKKVKVTQLFIVRGCQKIDILNIKYVSNINKLLLIKENNMNN